MDYNSCILTPSSFVMDRIWCVLIWGSSVMNHSRCKLIPSSSVRADPVFYGHDGNDNLNWRQGCVVIERDDAALQPYTLFRVGAERQTLVMCVMWTEWSYLLFLAMSTFYEIFYGNCRKILSHLYIVDPVQYNTTLRHRQHYVLVHLFITAAPSSRGNVS